VESETREPSVFADAVQTGAPEKRGKVVQPVLGAVTGVEFLPHTNSRKGNMQEFAT